MIFLIIIGIIVLIALIAVAAKVAESVFPRVLAFLIGIMILAGLSSLVFEGAVIVVKIIFVVLLVCIGIKLFCVIFGIHD